MVRAAATGVGWGVPSTYSDVQVLEEDKQCLPDQLELPSREIPINLPRQGGGRGALHFPLWAEEWGQAGLGPSGVGLR